MMSTEESTAEQTTRDAEGGGAIILNSTAEFCRTLGDIPTYGQAGNREEDVQTLMVSGRKRNTVDVESKAESNARFVGFAGRFRT